jgi:hypothetical protein
LPEFKYGYEEDSARVDRLGIYTCHDDHPLGRFVVGNGHTLRDNPKAQGLDIREELIKFYKQTYSANLMKLAIYGKGMCLLVLERNDVVTPLRRAVGHVDQMGGGDVFAGGRQSERTQALPRRHPDCRRVDGMCTRRLFVWHLMRSSCTERGAIPLHPGSTSSGSRLPHPRSV